MSSVDPLIQVTSFSTVDRELAELLGGGRSSVRATVALLSRALRSGHSCLSLQSLAELQLTNDAGEPALRLPGALQLIRELTESGILTTALPDGSGAAEFRPIVFDGARLYLRRYFDHEGAVVDGIQRLARPREESVWRFDERVDAYFAGAQRGNERQRGAVENALRYRVSLITGGPGTGKTTTVVKLLALLLERALADRASSRIALLAPTGKAAERLLRATSSAAERLALGAEIIALLPTESMTIHRALGVIPGVKTRFRHDRGNPLPFDLVVVDEVSMVDLALMSRLLDALKDGTRLVLLGDSDQLASVGAGSVLSELMDAARALEVETPNPHFSLGYSNLLESYRFAGAAGILQLSAAFRTGDRDRVSKALDEPYPDATFVDAQGFDSFLASRALRGELEARFRQSLRVASPEEALGMVHRFQVLCALRGGPFGTRAVNDWLRSLVVRGTGREGLNYVGRRVLITENEPRVGLYNGDIGVLWPTPKGQLLAHFPGESGRIRSFSLAELPAHEDAFAVTIHKSQGSEYDEVVLILPADGSPELMTRELLYTGITRARTKVTLLGGRNLLLAATERRAERHSGLCARLLQGARMSSSRG